MLASGGTQQRNAYASPHGADTYAYVGTTETVWRISPSGGGGGTTSAVAADGSRVSVSAGGATDWVPPDLHGKS